ncbi:MAG: 5-(carboxyamino)imidazole ribonucleotide synthase [Glaciimonas sp.]|nr:5-(carboxyamino)imidazole ribonucleotide synthase [Glaciimonas sp.]
MSSAQYGKKFTLTDAAALAPFIPTAAPATGLGVMGGGQLGRMFAQAAQAMGYKVAVLEPAQYCPAAHVAERHILAEYDDEVALAELATLCVAVTTEFENVSHRSLAFLAENIFIAPKAACVSIAQDRIAEKEFFIQCSVQSHIFPASYKTIASAADIDSVPPELLPGILKTVRLGYDGKGQARVQTRDTLRSVYAAMNGVHCILEKMLPLAYEVSVLVVRGADGAAMVYPIAENVHRDGILFTTTVPGPNIGVDAAKRAQDAAIAIVGQLGYVGVLCIEFFVLEDGLLVINEMAPRPHNSGHYTMDACITSQFAQQVRAMARMPLGDTRQHSPAIMLNILGDLWFTDDSDQVREPAWDQITALPGAVLHLYGKTEARRARKMGHITFIALTLGQAHAQLTVACAILGIVL